jgi:hypothetical protein
MRRERGLVGRGTSSCGVWEGEEAVVDHIREEMERLHAQVCACIGHRGVLCAERKAEGS